ncbi:MAG TPA: AAA family ATPase [Rhizomicrobium sp.]|nr:AAA family ATPase [Rhizomicrobium sp.]
MSEMQLEVTSGGGTMASRHTPAEQPPNNPREECARALAKFGFRIFPLKPGTKEPYSGEGWKAIMTTDPEQIRAWFATRHDMNYAVVCDEHHVILDPDEGFNKQGRKKEGIAQFHRAEEEALGFVEDSVFDHTLRVRTPKGGVHLYFAADKGYANSVGTIISDVDVRGPDGYVVGPGCTTFNDPAHNTAEGEYVIESDCDIAVLPDWLKARLELGGTVGKRAENAGSAAHQIDTPSAIEQACRLLRQRKPAIEGEGGDHHTVMTAMALKDYGVSEAKALELMFAKVLFAPTKDFPEGRAWNDTCEPPWDFEDLKTKVENAYRYGNRQIGSKMDALSAFDDEAVEAPDVESMDARHQTLAPGEHISAIEQPISRTENQDMIEGSIYKATDFLAREVHVEAIIPEWVPARGVTAVLAARGTGKSVWLEDFACRVTTDTPWNGIQPAPDWACVYLCGEDDTGLQLNLQAWKTSYGKFPADDRLVIADRVPNLMDTENVKAWAEVLKKRMRGRKVVLVIDTWQRATSTASQNDDKEMQKAIHQAEGLARCLNGCAIIAFHPPKGREDTITGSMVLENSTTCILEITGQKKEDRKIEVTRIKGPGEGNYVKFRIQDVSLELRDKSGKALKGVIAEFVGGAGMDPMQREIEEENRRGAWLSILAPLARVEIGENGCKPLSVTALIKRAQKKGVALGAATLPGKDEFRSLLAELFKDPYTFQDGWMLSLVTRHSQLKEFCLSPPGVAEAPG